jgi:hypothetical protein
MAYSLFFQTIFDTAFVIGVNKKKYLDLQVTKKVGDKCGKYKWNNGQ